MNFKKISGFIYQNAIYFVLLALVVAMTLVDPRFLSLTTLRDILLQSSTRMIIALGAVFAILTAGADLSAGRMVGLAAVISASMLQAPDYLRLFFPGLPQLPLFIPILIAIAACTLFGAINGSVIARFGVPPFIATLGSMVVIYGFTSIYFDLPPNQSQPIGGLRSDFTELGTGAIGIGPYSIPYIVIIAAVVTFLMWVLLNKTRFGKNTYAIGGNVNAAKVSGINVGRTTIWMYTIAGALYGLAGVLEAARTGGATNNYGNGYELDAIAACVVGGVSTTGGIGSVQGIVAGVLIFSVINYGLTFIGLNPYWQMIIKGLIIVSAVAVDIRKYISKR
ncbi:monosaccharide ABC transporter membrane protein (CUT2 family) [Hydrogenispora ethanolica]|jgi:methyl-galactoside transport system permease protein|uniref:Monosaccharide ABC transporter membrane protein (CUT2 family) n=1 Tax=Hydrogenispora ethanolica TaxID=1082276 RepID=A0A4R1QM16_HYDET|nr:galactose/methyl galactoside ABC transporter permease MglC [Hydrogenispora ethanolica]TCL54758.1 monosaccharide ABC transporter membrane protein (CUT2 family) [Hydrogenispora ethanolica]